MNDENTKKIIDACKSLYSNIETERENLRRSDVFLPIAFGFECGDGWFDILLDFSKKMQAYFDTQSENFIKSVYAVQIKEKFGFLRIYLTAENDVVSSYIKEAMQRSRTTCEVCGDTETASIRGKYHLYCACDKHVLEYDK